jgi:hypothetical protein
MTQSLVFATLPVAREILLHQFPHSGSREDNATHRTSLVVCYEIAETLPRLLGALLDVKQNLKFVFDSYAERSIITLFLETISKPQFHPFLKNMMTHIVIKQVNR